MRGIMIVVLVAISNSQDIGESREYLCERKSPKSTKSECRLRFGDEEEFSAINDNGCFMNFDDSRSEPVELCPLQCQRYNEAVIVKTSNCEPGKTLTVERRQSDWFMIRSGSCQSESLSVQFDCKFVPRVIEKNENELMEIEESLEDTTIEMESEGTTKSVIVSTEQIPVESTREKNDDENLPEKVEMLLGLLFPSYRKSNKNQ